MMQRDCEEPIEIFHRVRSSFDGKEVDDLNEELRLTFARLTHSFNQSPQARQKPIMPNAQQRPARNVAHAGMYDYQHGRLTFGESSIPIEIVPRDEPVFGRAPGHHRRHPRAILEGQWANLDWLKQK